MTEDLAASKSRVELRTGIKITAASVYDLDNPPPRPGVAALHKLSNCSRLVPAEVLRLAGVASVISPVLSLPNGKRKGSMVLMTSASSAMAGWVDQVLRPRVQEEVVAQCREKQPLSDATLALFDLLCKYLNVLSPVDQPPPIPMSAVAALRALSAPVPISDLLKLYGHCQPPTHDVAFLLSLGIHYLVSPFKLTLLRHPMCRRRTKLVFPSSLAYVEFLKFTSQALDPMQDALQMGEALYGSAEGLHKMVFTRLSSHLIVKDLSCGTDSFGAPQLLQDLPAHFIKTNPSLPQPSWTPLFPTLADQTAAADDDKTAQDAGIRKSAALIDSRLAQAGCLWWGPCQFVGKSLKESAVAHLVLKSLSTASSPALATIFRAVDSFTKVIPEMTVETITSIHNSPTENSETELGELADEEKSTGDEQADPVDSSTTLEFPDPNQNQTFQASCAHMIRCAFGREHVSALCQECSRFVFGRPQPVEDPMMLAIEQIPISTGFTRYLQ